MSYPHGTQFILRDLDSHEPSVIYRSEHEVNMRLRWLTQSRRRSVDEYSIEVFEDGISMAHGFYGGDWTRGHDERHCVLHGDFEDTETPGT